MPSNIQEIGAMMQWPLHERMRTSMRLKCASVLAPIPSLDCKTLQKSGDHPNFTKNALEVKKAILGALGEFRGILGTTLGIQKMILGYEIPFSEWHLTT